MNTNNELLQAAKVWDALRTAIARAEASASQPAPRDGDAEVCAYLRACVEDRREVYLAYVFQLLALRGGAS